MIDKKTLSIADEIVGAINQTDVWTELQREDPGIKDAEDRYDKALEAAQLPREVCIWPGPDRGQRRPVGHLPIRAHGRSHRGARDQIPVQ